MTIRFSTAVTLVFLLPAAALAQDMLDANADGMVSLDEVQAIHPEVDGDAFMQADSDGDALLDEEELDAARDAGLVPMADG
jgi:hypothetical protein